MNAKIMMAQSKKREFNETEMYESISTFVPRFVETAKYGTNRRKYQAQAENKVFSSRLNKYDKLAREQKLLSEGAP